MQTLFWGFLITFLFYYYLPETVILFEITLISSCNINTFYEIICSSIFFRCLYHSLYVSRALKIMGYSQEVAFGIFGNFLIKYGHHMATGKTGAE